MKKMKILTALSAVLLLTSCQSHGEPITGVEAQARLSQISSSQEDEVAQVGQFTLTQSITSVDYLEGDKMETSSEFASDLNNYYLRSSTSLYQKDDGVESKFSATTWVYIKDSNLYFVNETNTQGQINRYYSTLTIDPTMFETTANELMDNFQSRDELKSEMGLQMVQSIIGFASMNTDATINVSSKGEGHIYCYYKSATKEVEPITGASEEQQYVVEVEYSDNLLASLSVETIDKETSKEGNVTSHDKQTSKINAKRSAKVSYPDLTKFTLVEDNQ